MSKQHWVRILSACLGLLLVACDLTVISSPAAGEEMEQAQRTMIQFFDDLAAGEYRQAEAVFAGDVQVLADWNPDTNPLYRVTLLERACLAQLRCLPVLRVVSTRQTASDLFTFIIEFQTPEGEVFILGPCCGATETEMPPVSQFECDVELGADGHYKVLCLPPYVP